MGDEDVGAGLHEEYIKRLQRVVRIDVRDERAAEPLRVEYFGGQYADDLLGS